MSKIVGIDASLTGTGICVLQVGPGLFAQPGDYETFLIASKLKGPARLIEIRDRVANFCKNASMVLIEDYAFARAQGAHQIGELGGVLRVMFVEQGLNWIEVAPAAVKKFATGKGNASKEQIAAWVQKRWGVMFDSNDETDAFVLAKIGEALIASQVNNEEVLKKLIAPQREVIAILRGEKRKKTKKGGKRSGK